MKTLKVLSVIDGQPMFDKPLPEFLSQCEAGGIIQLLTATEYISDQQRKWFKGILLPALAKDTGDSIAWWETTLKTQVMPDEFAPVYVAIGKQVFPVIPSITKLSVKKMNTMIEGAVAYLRDECGLMWVTLPDKELRA
jgi:hypothetical protein